jgi:HPt (histidine-containing phosphotransfer) domain-containing protein
MGRPSDDDDTVMTQPAATESPLDVAHLARMTFGDRDLEREVLQLFMRQSAILLERMRGAPTAALVVSAHTLQGSARNVGAWRVARAAERLEQAAGDPNRQQLALAELVAALDEACRTIAQRLGALDQRDPGA